MDVNTCYATTEYIRTLALYSHLLPATATLILGVFAVVRAQDRAKALVFFGFTLAFALWLTFDLINWLTNSYTLLAATWAPLDYINIVFFLLLFYFIYIDFSNRNTPYWLSALLILLALTPFVITMTGTAVSQFNQSQCEMLDNDFLANYKLALEALILAATLIFGIYRIVRTWKDRNERVRIALITLAVVLFMGIFTGAEYWSTLTAVYETTLYSLFSLPIFVLILTLAITTYGTFRLGDVGVKVLFYIFLLLAGSQFFFVSSFTDFLLAVMSFVVVLVLGIMLYISNERQIRVRHQVEKLADELALTNQRQESLLHFVGHEVKGYLTKDMSAFAALEEGDLGPLPENVKTFIAGALTQARDGANSVIDILHASNQKKGTVEYKHEPFDLAALVRQWHDKVKPLAEKKGLALNLSIDESAGPYTIIGDGSQTGDHVLRNLFENSVNYTPSGSVTISLKKEGGKAILTIADTGVGITPEDKKKLFTEGGKGKDSIKVNVHSTGYGLFIAKNIIVAEGGTIRAESEGAGKGSQFITELPLQA